MTMDSTCSGPMTAWVLVLKEPNEDDKLVELLEVNANRIPAKKGRRSDYDWFYDDHWSNNEECFWDAVDRPPPGEYLIEFHIEGEWTYSSNGDDYDEELCIEKIDKVDLASHREGIL